MASYSPGQRIEARCTRCRDITGHIIVVVLDGEVAKVECCACGSGHKYYPAENKARPVKERPLRVQSGQERGEAVLNRSSARTRVELAAASGAGTGTVPRPAKLSRAEQQSAKLREELEHQWQEAMARNAETVCHGWSVCSRFTGGASQFWSGNGVECDAAGQNRRVVPRGNQGVAVPLLKSYQPCGIDKICGG